MRRASACRPRRAGDRGDRLHARASPTAIRPWVAGRYTVLGTDGYGRSDYRVRAAPLLRGRPPPRRGRRARRARRRGRRRDDAGAEADRGYEIDPDAEAAVAAVKDVAGPRHRGLHRRAGHRDRWSPPGDTVARRGPARHARVRQGDDGRPGAVRRASWELKVKVGDTVSEGSLLVTLAAAEGEDGGEPRPTASRGRPPSEAEEPAAAERGRRPRCAESAPPAAEAPERPPTDRRVRPPRRRRADLRQPRRCAASPASSASTSPGRAAPGRKGRITRGRRAAVESGARRRGRAGGGGRDRGLDLAPWPTVDFAKFGEVERVAAARASRRSPAPNLRAQLGDDPARHPQRRGRHHRPRGVPQAD